MAAIPSKTQLAYTVEPDTAKARTVPQEPGFQAVARPVLASTAAISPRGRPPIELNSPATYTVEPKMASAKTAPLASGFQGVARPVLVSTAAMWLRVWPPIAVKPPPTYTIWPEIASARTRCSLTSGFHALA
jgi:hypothetical protein